MFKKIFTPLIILIVFTHISCEYKPEGEIFSEIDQAEPPEEIVIDIGINSDTLYVTGWPKIPFKVIIDGFEFNNLIINLQDYQLYNSMQNGTWDTIGGIIDFRHVTLSDGLYDLTFEIIIHTGTNSLGNVYDMEFFKIDTVTTLSYKQFE